MLLSNAQFLDRLARVIAEEEKGQLNRLALGKLLCPNEILLLDIVAKFGHQVGIIHADPNDLCSFLFEPGELGPQVGKLPLAVGSPIAAIED